MAPVRKTIVLLSVASALAAAVACSSSSPSKTGGSDGGGGGDTGGGGADVGIDVIINPNNCVAPGTASNSVGVGGYCSPGGGQCDTAGPGGSPTLCSGDYNSTPNTWFCTVPCTGPSDCGSGAVCVTTAMGSGCTPNSCVSYIGDAGYINDGGGTSGEAATDGPGGG
jgi:hypothetical protein